MFGRGAAGRLVARGSPAVGTRSAGYGWASHCKFNYKSTVVKISLQGVENVALESAIMVAFRGLHDHRQLRHLDISTVKDAMKEGHVKEKRFSHLHHIDRVDMEIKVVIPH